MSDDTRAWWPEKDGRCGAINPEQTHYCEQPAGHDGDHAGPELPVAILEDS